MKILALNTAFSNSDVALMFDNQTDYISLNSSAKQSENILVCTNNLLSKNNVNIQEIDSIAVVVGPGSFTGIRIGVGLVKGIYAAKQNLKLISICSLDLMAHIYLKINPNSDFWCALDALSGNIFVCKYSNGKREEEPQMLTMENLDKISGTVVGLKGESIELCNCFVEFTPQTLLGYAVDKFNNNDFVTENNLVPLYLRKSQAEVGLENANNNN